MKKFVLATSLLALATPALADNPAQPQMDVTVIAQDSVDTTGQNFLTVAVFLMTLVLTIGGAANPVSLE